MSDAAIAEGRTLQGLGIEAGTDRGHCAGVPVPLPQGRPVFRPGYLMPVHASRWFPAGVIASCHQAQARKTCNLSTLNWFSRSTPPPAWIRGICPAVAGSGRGFPASRMLLQPFALQAPGVLPSRPVHWAGEARQATAVDWHLVRDGRTAAELSAKISASLRAIQGLTDIAGAIGYSVNSIEGKQLHRRAPGHRHLR